MASFTAFTTAFVETVAPEIIRTSSSAEGDATALSSLSVPLPTNVSVNSASSILVPNPGVSEFSPTLIPVSLPSVLTPVRTGTSPP
jgi:hypothetical protein